MSEENLIQEAPVVEEQPAPAPEVESTPAPTETEAPKEEVASTEAGPLSEEDLSEDKPDEEEKPKKSRFQDRIDRLTADKYAAERRARELQDRLQQYEERSSEREYDPEDYEQVERQRLREVLDEERRYDTATEAERYAQEAAQARTELFSAKLEAARDRIPDLQDSIRNFADLPVTVESAELIADSPKAAEIAHWMGSNPDTTIKISRMSPAEQGRAIAQIESRVSVPSRSQTNAPPPPAKLKPQSAPASKDPSEMSAAEYVTWRKAQWNNET